MELYSVKPHLVDQLLIARAETPQAVMPAGLTPKVSKEEQTLQHLFSAGEGYGLVRRAKSFGVKAGTGIGCPAALAALGYAASYVPDPAVMLAVTAVGAAVIGGLGYYFWKQAEVGTEVNAANEIFGKLKKEIEAEIPKDPYRKEALQELTKLYQNTLKAMARIRATTTDSKQLKARLDNELYVLHGRARFLLLPQTEQLSTEFFEALKDVVSVRKQISASPLYQTQWSAGRGVVEITKHYSGRRFETAKQHYNAAIEFGKYGLVGLACLGGAWASFYAGSDTGVAVGLLGAAGAIAYGWEQAMSSYEQHEVAIARELVQTAQKDLEKAGLSGSELEGVQKQLNRLYQAKLRELEGYHKSSLNEADKGKVLDLELELLRQSLTLAVDLAIKRHQASAAVA